MLKIQICGLQFVTGQPSPQAEDVEEKILQLTWGLSGMADDIVVEHVFSVCRNRRELKPYLCIVSDQTHQLKLAADALRGIGLDIKMQHLFKFIPAGEAAMDEMTQPACGGVPMLFPGDPLQA